MWFELSLLSALLLGVRRIYMKELTATFGNYSLSFLMMVFTLPPALLLFLFFPIPESIFDLSWQFWWPLLIIWLGIYPIQNYFMFRSLREGELSAVTPISALLPVINLGTSYVILNETVSTLGLIGIVVVVIGTYLLLFDGKRAFTLNKPVLFMLIAVTCIAFGSTLDKVAIGASTPIFYAFVNMLGASCVFLALTYVWGEIGDLKNTGKRFWMLSILGLVSALAVAAFMTAFQAGPTSYVLAIRAGGLFLPVFWGLFFLRESLTWRKMCAVALFTIGIILLASLT